MYLVAAQHIMRQVHHLVNSLLFSGGGYDTDMFISINIYLVRSLLFLAEGTDMFMIIIAISEDNATTPLEGMIGHMDSLLGLLSCLLVSGIDILHPTRVGFSQNNF